MNVGKLHAIADQVVRQYKAHNVLPLWQAMVSHLQTAIANPGNPDMARTFNEHLANFKTAAAQIQFDGLTPTQRKIFAAIDGPQFTGQGLLQKFEEIVAANRVALALAIPQLSEHNEKISQYISTLEAMLGAFKKLNVEKDSLPENEAEVAFAIPKGSFNPDLTTFSKELRQYDLLLRAFNELTTTNQGKVELRTISSSDWEIYVGISIAALIGINWALKQLSQMLREMVSIKADWDRLVKMGLPASATDPLKTYIDSHIEVRAREIADRAIVEFRKDDAARNNELANQINQALKFLASKLDSGVTVDLRIGIPAKPKGDANDPDVQKSIEDRRKLLDLRVEVTQTSNELLQITSQTHGELRLAAPDLEADRS